MWRGAALAGVAGVLIAVTLADAASVLRGTVVYVDDGDTIDVSLGGLVERVRYIGVDAPEIAHEARPGRTARRGEPGGLAATRFNAQLVAGRSVMLELDAEPRDRYGRLLAYVWIGSSMVNAELIARGHARALVIPPNLRYAAWFATLEADARVARRGLWSSGPSGALATVGSSEVFRVSSRSRVAHVAHVRPCFPERHRARVRALRQDRYSPGALRAEPALCLAQQRARHPQSPLLR
jgi:endonuclease YncB( thermonuclease family)